MSANGLRHFLDLIDIPAQQLRGMIEASRAMKTRRPRGPRPLEGRTLAMIFDKPSTRTRVSFDVAMRQLGGEAIMLTGQEMQLGRGETIADTARVLSRYVDIIMIRTLDHNTLTELARHATVPVINGLTRRSHPCQVLADVMTFEEHRGPIRGKTVAWTGDANNVLASWMHAAERFDFRLRVATPPELAPKKWLVDWIRGSGAAIDLGSDPDEAVKGCDCVVTDTWVSMGDKDGQRRHNLLSRYQVNARLMARAKPDALFMHCLPAHRGDEGRNRSCSTRPRTACMRKRASWPGACTPGRGERRRCASFCRQMAGRRGEFSADQVLYVAPSCPVLKFQRARPRPSPRTIRSCPSRSKRSTCAGASCASAPPSTRSFRATTIPRRWRSSWARRSCSRCSSAPR
jgi:ornithine carbamoyltransferase